MRRGTAWIAAALLAACASGPAPYRLAPEPRDESRSAPRATPIEASIDRPALPEPASAQDRFGPSILVPKTPAEDGVVAVVGDVRIHESHVYERMLENDRRGATMWADLLVMECVVAEHARHYGIVVTREEIEPLVRAEIETLRAQVQAEFGDRLSFEEYLQRQFGLDAEQYRASLALLLARRRYQSYVIRYLAMREDQVEVRFIVHRDPEVLEDVRQKVVSGADFATLARRWSEDDSRRDGGLLAPFGREFRHPIAKTAFELEPGAVSAVVAFDGSEGTRHAIVYCLRRMPAREAPFSDVREEIVAELERRPITAFEERAFRARYCESTAPPTGEGEPR